MKLTEILDYERRLRLRRMLGRHYATTPTSMVNRMMGLEAWTDAIALPAGTTVGGAFAGANAPVAVPAATTTLTMTQALHGGKVVTLASTGGLVITPPPATGTGTTYRIWVLTTISGGNVTLDFKAAAASDIALGMAFTYKATSFTSYITVANTNLVTWDGSTMGGIAGDFLEMTDMATNKWRIGIWGNQTGTIATPFSNH